MTESLTNMNNDDGITQHNSNNNNNNTTTTMIMISLKNSSDYIEHAVAGSGSLKSISNQVNSN